MVLDNSLPSTVTLTIIIARMAPEECAAVSMLPVAEVFFERPNRLYTYQQKAVEYLDQMCKRLENVRSRVGLPTYDQATELSTI